MNGILLINKPEGWTSNDVVQKLRGLLHEKRIGHAGTLDPLATGLLVVFVGRATRCVSFAEGHDKRYLAGMRLGLVTDTQDITGHPLESPETDQERDIHVTPTELESSLEAFRGPIEQIPPMYSAIKIKGQKLYEIARRGGEVERKARTVTIHELRLLSLEGAEAKLDIRCSKGTYIRTLCHDLGERLGCGACMSSLCRLESGGFRLEDAFTLEQVAAGDYRLLPADTLFAEYPAIKIGEKEESRLRNGGDFRFEGPDGVYRVYGKREEFLALGRLEGNRLRTIKSFFEV